MTRYVDGFILPVPKDRLDEYRAIAELAGKVWREHGALDYVECLAQDVPQGKLTSFPLSVQLKQDETVIFAWILYASREERDRVNAAAMADERLSGFDKENVPFDPQRMIFGGFEVLVQA